MQKIILGLVLLCFTLPIMAADDETPAEKNPAYISLGKPMILNMGTGDKKLRFLQVQADVLVADENTRDEVELHIPAMRHQLIVLLSEQDATDMKSPVEREKVRKQATENIRKMIREMTGNDDVKEVLFSTFLVQ